MELFGVYLLHCFRINNGMHETARKDKLTGGGCWPELATGRCSILGVELGPGLSSHAGVVRVAQVQGHTGR